MSEVMDSYFIDDHILLQELRSVAIKLVYIIGDHLELLKRGKQSHTENKVSGNNQRRLSCILSPLEQQLHISKSLYHSLNTVNQYWKF